MANKYIIKSKDLINKIIDKIKRANFLVDKYKEFGKIPAMPSNAFINMASQMYSMGRLQEAEDLLRSAICFPSKSSNALLNLGIIKQSTGNYNQAIKFYLAAYRKDKMNSKALVLWGNCLAVMNKLDGAVKKYEHAVKINPDDAEAFLSWGALLIKQGHYRSAKEKLQLSMEKNKKDLRPLYMIGIVDIELGNYESALNALNHVLKCTENNHEALHNIAYIYFKMQRYDEAISYAKKSLAVFQYKIETYLLLGDIYALKNKEKESLTFYAMAESNGLKTFFLYLSWATSLQKFGYYAEAIEKLEPVKEMVSNINKDEIYARLALSYVKTNKKELAQENILKSLEINPENHLALFLYAQIEIDNNEYLHAMELLKKCEKDYETKGKNYMLQAICNLELGNIEGSKSDFEKALEYSNGSEDIILEYMKFLIDKKNYELANTKFKQIMKTTDNKELLNNYFIITYNIAKQNSYKYNVEKALDVIKKIESLGYEHCYNDEKAELEGILRDYE